MRAEELIKNFNTPGVSVLYLEELTEAIVKSVFQYSRCVGVIVFPISKAIKWMIFQYSRCVGVIQKEAEYEKILEYFNTPGVSVL